LTMATTPVGFRKGADGLAALVRETMKADPFSGQASPEPRIAAGALAACRDGGRYR
jgi:hypothetical protein